LSIFAIACVNRKKFEEVEKVKKAVKVGKLHKHFDRSDACKES